MDAPASPPPAECRQGHGALFTGVIVGLVVVVLAGLFCPSNITYPVVTANDISAVASGPIAASTYKTPAAEVASLVSKSNAHQMYDTRSEGSETYPDIIFLPQEAFMEAVEAMLQQKNSEDQTEFDAYDREIDASEREKAQQKSDLTSMSRAFIRAGETIRNLEADSTKAADKHHEDMQQKEQEHAAEIKQREMKHNAVQAQLVADNQESRIFAVRAAMKGAKGKFRRASDPDMQGDGSFNHWRKRLFNSCNV